MGFPCLLGNFLVEEFPVDVHLLLLDNHIVIRLSGLRGMAATFCLVADAQGAYAHQVLLDPHVTEQLLSPSQSNISRSL